MLPFNQKQIVEQATFICSPLGKDFEKEIKAIVDQGGKQIKALKDLKPKELEAIKDSKFNFYFKDSNLASVNFIGIKNGNVSIEKIDEDKKLFKLKLNEINTGNPNQKINYVQ